VGYEPGIFRGESATELLSVESSGLSERSSESDGAQEVDGPDASRDQGCSSRVTLSDGESRVSAEEESAFPTSSTTPLAMSFGSSSFTAFFDEAFDLRLLLFVFLVACWRSRPSSWREINFGALVEIMVAASEVRKICDLMRWRYRALGEKIRSCEILLNQWLGKKAS
jgi:hypothetical protein